MQPSPTGMRLYDTQGHRRAHQTLDRAVDVAYRKQSFDSERHRVEFLFDLYQKYTAPLAVEGKKKRSIVKRGYPRKVGHSVT
jgi:hypothetical protein